MGARAVVIVVEIAVVEIGIVVLVVAIEAEKAAMEAVVGIEQVEVVVRKR